jgi:hypothetical protein
MTAPAEVRPPSPSPAPARSSGSSGWSAPVFGAVIALVTVVTIGLAVIAPQLGENVAGDLPSGWAVVFDSDLSNPSSDWKVGADCGFDRGGLFANSGDSPCVYTPSSEADYISQGFRLDATLAPASAVDKSQVAVVVAGTAYFGIAQDGSFALADDARTSDEEVRDTAFNWHANGLTPNTIRLEWRGPGTPLVAYTNGFKVAEVEYSISPSSSHALQIGASRDGQAIYTHMTLASASAQG